MKKRTKLNSKSILLMLEEHSGQIQKYSVRRIGLFGSFLKNKQKKNSDLDFLVEFEKPTFDNYMELKFMLEELFHRKVDLVMEECLKPALDHVRREAAYVS
ncbi:nucleotidyltransferase family protein [Candidatus Micrarchaeota archaeon]|nr:nucleotidyltransferase family protein [Candidatus Micrarchaeota archaeon]